MSVIDSLHQARKQRLQRIAGRAVPQADEPVRTPGGRNLPRPAGAKRHFVIDAAYERAWAAEIMGLTGQQVLPPRPPRIAEIQRATARRFGLPFDRLLAHRREHKVCEARHAAMYLARKLTLKSFGEIARVFGDRDHSAVLYGVRRIEAKLPDDGELAATIARIRRDLEVAGQ
jgi:hypothetical protein